MIIGGGVSAHGQRMKTQKHIPAHCNWIHFYCRRNDFGAYNHHRRRLPRAINETGQSREKLHVAAATAAATATAAIPSLHHLCRATRLPFALRLPFHACASFVHSSSCTHHRPDFVSSALHCYFNLLQKEPKSSRGRHHHHVALYHIIWIFFLLVFLSNSSRHSHFIFRFFLHIITISIRFEICNAQDANNNNNNRSIEKWYASARGNRNKGKTKLIINHRQCVRPLQRDVCGRTDVGSNNGHALARAHVCSSELVLTFSSVCFLFLLS